MNKKKINYYIYHIEGVKIGCSVDAAIRVKTQGYNEYIILEEHTDILKASNREIELQKKYGYEVDRIPYYLSIQHFDKAKSKINYSDQGKKLVKWCNENGHYDKIHSLGGKVQGKINAENGHLERMRAKSNFNKKSILAFNRFTNELVGEFNSLTECGNKLNLCISKISSTLHGKRKYHKDYTFSFKLCN